jgi:quercetin dioxygenase-like cupin family protein
MNAAKGLVVPAGGGKRLDMTTPGRFAALKLLGRETDQSIMLFEETVPAGTKSLYHLHRDSDEVAWVLSGEITVQIGDEVSVHAGRRRRLHRGALESPRPDQRR